MNRPFQKYGNRLVRFRPSRKPGLSKSTAVEVRPHISRTALARWYNRTCSRSEKREIERHFLFCSVCQRQITLKQLADIAKGAKKRLMAAVHSAERN